MLRRQSSFQTAPSLGSSDFLLRVLAEWRTCGPDAARQILPFEPPEDPLLQELYLRLYQKPGPRLLLDGLWFSRTVGGISRVWDQILRCWQLPDLFYDQSPLLFSDRESRSVCSGYFPSLVANKVDPLDISAVAAAAEENALIATDWGADVFLSSWISTTGAFSPACSELALVHDCMPERSTCPEGLRSLRRRWLKGASAHLAVSADTAADVALLLKSPFADISWCHPAPDPLFVSMHSHDMRTDI